MEKIGLKIETQFDSIVKLIVGEKGLSARQPENYDTIRADLMSVGIVMFMLLVGTLPFSGNSSRKLLEEAQVGYFSFTHPLWRQVSPSAKDFIKRMTQR